MSAQGAPLARVSTVDALTAALRAQILDGDLEPGRRLPERELTERFAVARHSLRAALRALDAEGLVRIEPHRGASVRRMTPDEAAGLYELRAALELEAARLALDRGRGRLPEPVTAAAEHLARVCDADPGWGELEAAHARFHEELVAAGGSERIARAHAALAGETRLFLMGLRPHWTRERMAADHLRLPGELEREGPEALRRHLRESFEAVTGSA